jgi:two-component system chemotaxis response regulator CheB
VEAIRGAHAARDNLRPLKSSRAPDAEVVLPALGNDALSTSRVVVMGASTGGAEALREMMPALPTDCPPVLVSLHLSAAFTRHLAGRLDAICKVTVKVPVDGEPAIPGHVYIAPGDHHMTVQRYGSRGFGIRLQPGAPRPSVDLLFQSAAQQAGADAIGVILTGNGDDGAQGLLEMRQAGAHTIAQDQESCIVHAMPRAATELGAVVDTAPLGRIPFLVLGRFAAESRDTPESAAA